jgi:hypothetical protein
MSDLRESKETRGTKGQEYRVLKDSKVTSDHLVFRASKELAYKDLKAIRAHRDLKGGRDSKAVLARPASKDFRVTKGGRGSKVFRGQGSKALKGIRGSRET